MLYVIGAVLRRLLLIRDPIDAVITDFDAFGVSTLRKILSTTGSDTDGTVIADYCSDALTLCNRFISEEDTNVNTDGVSQAVSS